jgi:hypothetical protein
VRKRILKKAYKRVEAENRRLKYEVKHPMATVRILLTAEPGGTVGKCVMVNIDDEDDLRCTIRHEVEKCLYDWNFAALENARKRENTILGQMQRMAEFSARPAVVPLAALMDRMEAGVE